VLFVCMDGVSMALHRPVVLISGCVSAMRPVFVGIVAVIFISVPTSVIAVMVTVFVLMSIVVSGVGLALTAISTVPVCHGGPAAEC